MKNQELRSRDVTILRPILTPIPIPTQASFLNMTESYLETFINTSKTTYKKKLKEVFVVLC